MNKAKATEWAKRYIPPDIAGIIFTLCGAGMTYALTGNRAAAAVVGTASENIGYYGYISIREIAQNKAKYEKAQKPFGLTGYLKTVRDLVLEFGFAELLDSALIRPFWLYWLPIWVSNYPLGIFLGKLAADVTFYVPTIISYELRKHYIRD